MKGRTRSAGIVLHDHHLPATTREDFRVYLQELSSQGVTSILVPLWLKEHREGDLDEEEQSHRFVFEYLNADKIVWLTLENE